MHILNRIICFLVGHNLKVDRYLCGFHCDGKPMYKENTVGCKRCRKLYDSIQR